MKRGVIGEELGRVDETPVAGGVLVDTGAALVTDWIVAARSAASDDRGAGLPLCSVVPQPATRTAITASARRSGELDTSHSFTEGSSLHR
jgi:hypothetical protein